MNLPDDKRLRELADDTLVNHNCAGKCGCDACKLASTVLSLLDRIEELEAQIKQADIDEDFLLKERDNAEEWADKLAAAIDPGEEIGEHSNLNNPWANALEMIGDKLEALTAAEAERDRMKTALEDAKAGYCAQACGARHTVRCLRITDALSDKGVTAK